MSWLEKILPKSKKEQNKKHSIPEGLWEKCKGCDKILYSAKLKKNLSVCPDCATHMYISARDRLEKYLDNLGKQEIGKDLKPNDVLKFKDSKKYKDRFQSAQKQTKENDALIAMQGYLKKLPIVACAFEFKFMGGSMGSVVGQKFVLACQKAIEIQAPLICFCASGGARMQEALFSLMQMAKTSAALEKLGQSKLPFISVLTNPTMGGVSASLAMLGDINIAEPKALIGFAGPKVIEQTVREKLPKGFQKSEFLLEKGAIDMIVDRRDMRDTTYNLLARLMHLEA